MAYLLDMVFFCGWRGRLILTKRPYLQRDPQWPQIPEGADDVLAGYGGFFFVGGAFDPGFR